MRVTKRCRELLRVLASARWLTTSQVRRRFFPHASADAARKRMRKLVEAGYVNAYREHRMAEALYTLGPEGKRMLEKVDGQEITLERKPPKLLEHFIAVNDLRIAAELSGSLRYFFAYWELPGLGWQHELIPDGVFSLGNRTFAVEFDRGLEGLRYFVRSKVALYSRGLPGLPLSAVLVVADREARIRSLAKAVPNPHGLFLFTTLDLVRREGILAPVFQRGPEGKVESLV